MKADKTFYDTLREEVCQGKLSDSHCFLIRSKPIKQVNENTSTLQTHKSAISQPDDVIMLKEKIEGLLSQVDLLEKRNLELTEKNKELEARIMRAFEELPQSITSDEIDVIVDNSHEIEKTEIYTGYIALKAIVKWVNNMVDNDKSHLFKSMIYDTMPILTEEERQLVQKIGFRERDISPIKINNHYEAGSNNQVVNGDVHNSSFN